MNQNIQTESYLKLLLRANEIKEQLALMQVSYETSLLSDSPLPQLQSIKENISLNKRKYNLFMQAANARMKNLGGDI